MIGRETPVLLEEYKQVKFKGNCADLEGGILYFRDYKQANKYVTTIKWAGKYIVSE